MSPDQEFVLAATKGNHDAANLIMTLSKICDLWDDLVDGDKELTEKNKVELFWMCLVTVPSNPFYKQHYDMLVPVLATGVCDWIIANTFEKSGEREKVIVAHNLRFFALNTALFIVLLCGRSLDHVREFGPELWARGQQSTLEEFLKEKGF